MGATWQQTHARHVRGLCLLLCRCCSLRVAPLIRAVSDNQQCAGHTVGQSPSPKLLAAGQGWLLLCVRQPAPCVFAAVAMAVGLVCDALLGAFVIYQIPAPLR